MSILTIQAPTGTVTLMFTDIVGSTALRDALVALHGEGEGNRVYGQRFLDPHNERIRGFIETHRGFEVKTIGDSFMVAFAQPEDAVRCAVDIQRSLRDAPIVTDDPLRPLAVRIGMHTGAVTLVERDGRADYDGHAVNIAARVESLMKGGERVYCSGSTESLARMGPGIRFQNYGPYSLKGVLSERVEIVDVLWDDAMKPAAPEQPPELPYPWLTKWIGREREIAELQAALRTHKLVTLHGTGGVGKTRLAVETLLAAETFDGPRLPRDTVFVSLEGANTVPDGFVSAVRKALGLTEVDAPDLTALCRKLRGSDKLLLLDNFESVMAETKTVSLIAALPGVRILVTGQQALGVNGERVVELEPMVTEGNITTLESYRLFVGLAQRRDARWQPDDSAAMREVLTATDGLPYLIELVATVAPKRVLRQLADELKTHVTTVQARSGFAAAERHASVLACLEWASGLLPKQERNALPRLAIFANGFNAEAAEAVTATPLASLDVLVDASLIRFDRETGRYSMLATTSQFVNHVLATDERVRISSEHARWFIDRLVRADRTLKAKGGEAQALARKWIDADFQNIAQAVAWAEDKERDLFERAVAAFGMYLHQTCRFSENVRLNEALLSRLCLDADPEAWARAQNNLGVAFRDLPTGDRDRNSAKAISCFEEALRVRTERDFPVEWSMTEHNLGIAYSNLPTGNQGGNLGKAIDCYQAALQVRTKRDLPLEWAQTQYSLGNAYAELPTGDRGDNLARAIAFLEEALLIMTEGDFPADWAATKNSLGLAFWRLAYVRDASENLPKAILCFEAALRVRTEHDSPAGWAALQGNLGIAYSHLPVGDPTENLTKAFVFNEAALRVYTEQDFPEDWAGAQNNLANIYTLLPGGDREENLANAIRCLQATLRVRNEHNSPAAWAQTQNNLGNAYEELAAGKPGYNLQEAIACFESAARGYLAVGLMDRAKVARQRAAALVIHSQSPSEPRLKAKLPARRKPRRR
ncbi:MAG TPA: adenylate/guanylate cyclase domain-containing protein [Thermoanaerobaculia bacterium]|nr:adenylate/guanylate cyclase domain-containing protein [Thermoanaerobaculia bacterium]